MSVTIQSVVLARGYKMQQGVTVEEAIQIIRDSIESIQDTLFMPIQDTLGYVLAKDMYSKMNQPPFHRSPVDGYACHYEDVSMASKANPARIKVVAEVDAGDYYPHTIQRGEAVRIMTGGRIPDGCDVCIWQETTNYGDDFVEVYKSYNQYENICFAGEDFAEGELLITKGSVITYVEIGILSAMGIDQIPVYRKPNIALITTGSETMMPGEALLPGKIYNSNRFMLEARMKQLGISLLSVSHVVDDAHCLVKELDKVIQQADLVITTGGVSVGKKDILHEALELVGAKKLFWQVKLKPGSPTIYSQYQGKPIISLTGNPFGTITNFELLVRPGIAKLSRNETLVCKKVSAISLNHFKKVGNVPRYVRAIYQDGKVKAADGIHTSGATKSMIGCNALMVIPAGQQLMEQDEVDVILL